MFTGSTSGTVAIGNLLLQNRTISGATGATGDIRIEPSQGDVVFGGNLLPGSTAYSLGTTANPWYDVIVGPQSIKILPEGPTGTTIVLENVNDILSLVGGAGFSVEDATAGFPTFEVDPFGYVTVRSLNSTDGSPLRILGSSGASPISPIGAGTLLYGIGQDGNPAQVLLDTFNNAIVSPGSAINFQGRASRGTNLSPLAVQTGDNLAAFSARGYNGSNYGSASSLQFVATENFTTSAQGTQMSINLIPTGSTGPVIAMSLGTTGINLGLTGSGVRFPNGSFQTTAYLGTATNSIVGGVKPDGTTITIDGNGVISSIGGTGGAGSSGTSGTSGSSGTSGTSGPRGATGLGGITAICGSFYDSTLQTNAGATSANPMTFNTTDFATGISIQNSSEITITEQGTYNIQFSAQIDKTDSGNDQIEIWLSKNGTNIPDSSTTLEVVGNNSELVAAWNWLVEANAGDYFEILWQSNDLNIRLLARAAQTNPTRPAIPSAILTVSQVTYTQLGPTGAAGSSGSSGSSGTSGISGSSGSSGTSGISPTTGSWTLIPGANTVSFTVTAGQSYVMWVNGNIPNGIVNWNATVTLSNTNVPAIGVQYGWYYLAGNALVLTSIPSHIVGTAGSISTLAPGVLNSNIFTFGITNNSGLSQIVYYGYTKVS
jgi:hypothetical protein